MATAIETSHNQPSATKTTPIAIGAVGFINTLPLIDGLDNLRDVAIRRSVPSLLLDQLLNDEVEIALCSTIDYQRSTTPLQIVPVGQLGCAGTTMTVRLYSQIPIEEITRVHCDTDSHTSIALMQILLRELHSASPQIVDYDAREHVANNRPLEWPEAMLLIGDKVVTDSPPAIRYPHQLDLGHAWKQMTGLPFVFATWMAKRDADPQRLAKVAAVLDHQRRHNRERIDRMIVDRAVQRDWPADLAQRYLKRCLRYEWNDESEAAGERFFALAEQHGLTNERRMLQFFDGVST